MITAFSITGFVLIDRLNLEAGRGFTALTGETGAGKSIILDALGAALGGRADKRFVKSGRDRAVASVEFSPPQDHPVWAKISEAGLDVHRDEPLILKRLIPKDGPARAFVNDQPVSAAFTAEIGSSLVEIHAQHAAAALLKPSTHRHFLDAFAGNSDLLARCQSAWSAWRAAADVLEARRTAALQAMTDRAASETTIEELERLSVQPGEVDDLTLVRTLGMQSERIKEATDEAADALDNARGAECLSRAARALERILRLPGIDAGSGGALLTTVTEARDAAERALAEWQEVERATTVLATETDHDANALAQAEERLFAIRAAARKYAVEPDALNAVLETARMSLAENDADATAFEAAEENARRTHGLWRREADALHMARSKAAQALGRKIEQELAPLKLDKVKLQIRVDALPECEGGAGGCERVEILVETNPGAGFGPLKAVASGGELARLSLALRCALATERDATPLVFDEADQGVGPAVAAAIGERLARLAEQRQVFAVTHSPQVAARAQRQWRIEKAEGDRGLGETRATVLNGQARREEIARMLSGAVVTKEARAAADRLLEG